MNEVHYSLKQGEREYEDDEAVPNSQRHPRNEVLEGEQVGLS